MAMWPYLPIGVAEIAGPTESNNVRPNPSTTSKPVGTVNRGDIRVVFDRSIEGDRWLSLNKEGTQWTAEYVGGVVYAKFYAFNESTPVEKPANVSAEMKRMVALLEAGKPIEESKPLVGLGSNWLPIVGAAVGVVGLAWLLLKRK
jgi:hypothetical protein